jgi:predicted nucleotidyltransferase
MGSKASAARERQRRTEQQVQLEALAAQLRPVFEKHHVLRAIVFGSLARGEASRRSDVDLLVVQPTDKRFLERYDGLLHDITQAVEGRDVDLLIYTPQELAQLAHRPLIVAALREGKAIYELQQEPPSGPTAATNG